MNYHVLTLFPEMILDGMNTSIIGRAMAKGLLTLEAVNIRDYSVTGNGRIDDYPYGGGAGMVMQAEPVYRACRDVVRLADVLGHSSIETTRIYLLTTSAEHERTLERLNLVS